MPGAYYNENDKEKAAWLRAVIKAGLVAAGEVDERSIADVQPDDLARFTQCHFFAGIGVWSYALRLAGWADDEPVWTGSCPCPSFSAAGKGQGFDDPRHLWPDWIRLIRKRRPAVVFGEQADDAIGFGWLDLVQTDLEAQGYAVGKAVLGACSVGAPHIRQRLYFVGECANAEVPERERAIGAEDGRRGTPKTGGSSAARHRSHPNGRQSSDGNVQRSGEQRLLAETLGVSRRADAVHSQRRALGQHGEDGRNRQDEGRQETHSLFGAHGEVLRGGDAERSRLQRFSGDAREWRGPGWLDPQQARSATEAGSTRDFWADCDWWWGRDEKYRPIEPGLFPLAHGATSRVLKLRGYGDAIVPQAAAAFIRAYREIGVKER